MTEYQKLVRNSAMLASATLGEYDKDEKYVIPQNIVEILVKGEKLLTSYKQDVALCEGTFGFNKYNFKIKFMEDEHTEKRYASLYLIESYTLYGEKITLETFLIKYSEKNDYEFLSKLKKVFKLTTRDESEGKEIKNSADAIDKIVKEKKARSKYLIEALKAENKRYVLQVMSVLKKSGMFGKDMQAQLKKRLADLKLDKNNPDYWLRIKEILDELLEEHKEEMPEETKKWIELINQNYIQMYMNKNKAFVMPKEEVKAPSKPKPPKSKPKDKKKDKKKDKSKSKDKSKDKGKDKPKDKGAKKPEPIKPVYTEEKFSMPKELHSEGNVKQETNDAAIFYGGLGSMSMLGSIGDPNLSAKDYLKASGTSKREPIKEEPDLSK